MTFFPAVEKTFEQMETTMDFFYNGADYKFPWKYYITPMPWSGDGYLVLSVIPRKTAMLIQLGLENLDSAERITCVVHLQHGGSHFHHVRSERGLPLIVPLFMLMSEIPRARPAASLMEFMKDTIMSDGFVSAFGFGRCHIRAAAFMTPEEFESTRSYHKMIDVMNRLV